MAKKMQLRVVHWVEGAAHYYWVPGYQHNTLGWHHEIIDATDTRVRFGQGWSVRHLASGMQVCWSYTMRGCRDIVNTLEHTTNWAEECPLITEELVKAMQALRSRYPRIPFLTDEQVGTRVSPLKEKVNGK